MKLDSVPVADPDPELRGIGTLGLLLEDLEEARVGGPGAAGVAFGTPSAGAVGLCSVGCGFFFLVWTTFPSGHRVHQSVALLSLLSGAAGAGLHQALSAVSEP